MSDPAVTVVIPTIPPRGSLLARALRSVSQQTYAPVQIAIAVDEAHEGAAATRQKALDRVTTPYVAFLDDDDELWPRHIELCIAHQLRTGADVVYPWFEVDGGEDPFPDRFGRAFDGALLRTRQFVPITVLAVTASVREAGGFTENVNELGWTQEDWGLWLAMLDQGARFEHLAKQTWTWYHWGGNTSGNAKNW